MFPKVFKWLDRVRQETNPYHDESLAFVNHKAKLNSLAKL